MQNKKHDTCGSALDHGPAGVKSMGRTRHGNGTNGICEYVIH